MSTSCVVSSHVEASIGRFFLLMRYSLITQLCSCLVLVLEIFLDSNMAFPSSSISNKIVGIGILSPITLFNQETWKIGWTCEDIGSSNLKSILPTFYNTL
jgi:hypothetical protein